MSALPDMARSTASRHGMFSGRPVVVAMVSGGADSIALLRLLASGEFGELAGLSALHVNHMLRGEAADADQAFVQGTCAELGVPCSAVRYDVAAFAKERGLNLEDAGRQLRYRFAEEELDSRCAALGIQPEHGRIAVAHTFDDRLETLLSRLVTGAGAGGLRSIAPVRGRVVRPLLDARRVQVTGYLESLGQRWCEDASNLDTSRQRAWVRHELLPLIESRNPAFSAVAARMLTILGEEDDLLAEMASAFACDFSSVEEGALVFERPMVRTLSRPMARRTVRAALLGAFPEASRIEAEHVEALVDGMSDDSFAHDLPFGLRATSEYGRLRISHRGGEPLFVAPGLLEMASAVDLGAGGRITAREVSPGVLATEADRVTIDADRVCWPMVVDGVSEGDRIRPFGMEGTKKVGDLLTDAKVPRRVRSTTPVVRDGDRIVWVAGVRLAEGYAIGPDTKRVAELTWERPSGARTTSETREG